MLAANIVNTLTLIQKTQMKSVPPHPYRYTKVSQGFPFFISRKSVVVLGRGRGTGSKFLARPHFRGDV